MTTQVKLQQVTDRKYTVLLDNEPIGCIESTVLDNVGRGYQAWRPDSDLKARIPGVKDEYLLPERAREDIEALIQS